MKKNFNKKNLRYFDANRNNNFTNNCTNNFVRTYYEPRSELFNNISDCELKKIIKKEFESFIIPYETGVFKLKEDIKILYNNNSKTKFNSSKFVDKELFNQSMKKMESEIDSRFNDLKGTQNKLYNILMNDKNHIQYEVNNNKNNNSINTILELNKEKNASFNDFNKLNELFDNFQENMNSIKNKLISSLYNKNKINVELDSKFENLKNDFNSNSYNLYNNKINEDMKKINNEYNINKNENIENTIYEVLKKLNPIKFSNFDLDKFYTVQKSCNTLMENYSIIAKLVNNVNYKLKKELNELNKINNQMNMYKISIEANSERISELKNEFNEEKNINLENRNNIKTNKEKLIELEEKNNKSEDIIKKLDEEKFEKKIKKIEEELAYNIEEGKKLDKINNEINMKNKNITEKIEKISQEIIYIKKEIDIIKNDKLPNNNLKSFEEKKEDKKEKKLEKNKNLPVEVKKADNSEENDGDYSNYQGFSFEEV